MAPSQLQAWEGASTVVHGGDSTVAGSEHRTSIGDTENDGEGEEDNDERAADAVATLEHLQGLLARMQELRQLSRSLGLVGEEADETDANVEGAW